LKVGRALQLSVVNKSNRVEDMARIDRPTPITRRTVLGGLGAAATHALLSGCGGVNSRPVGNYANPQPVPSGPLVPASISVSNRIAGVIGPRFAGLSYDKLSMSLPRFTPHNADLIGMFRTLGRSMLRIGGNSVDLMHWAPNGTGLTSGEIAPSDIDALAGFLEATEWTVLYSVNLAASTPAAAAAEVAYAAQSLGSHLYGIEFGNEPNQYGAANYFPVSGQGTMFETTVSASGLDVSAYAVERPDGGVNLVAVNKDTTQNLKLTIDCGQAAHSADLIVMTGPSLEATSGVAIQGAMVAQSGGFAPAAPHTVTASDGTISCYLAPLSAALIQIA